MLAEVRDRGCGSRRRWPKAALLCLFSTLAMTAADAQFVLDADAVVVGGGSSASPCSHLTSSIGEPAAGFSSGGAFSLSTGFLAIAAPAARDALFFDGFEGCLP